LNLLRSDLNLDQSSSHSAIGVSPFLIPETCGGDVNYFAVQHIKVVSQEDTPKRTGASNL